MSPGGERSGHPAALDVDTARSVNDWEAVAILQGIPLDDGDAAGDDATEDEDNSGL